MTDKQAIIRRMIDMQRQFIEAEHAGEVDPRTCFSPAPDHPLARHREDFQSLANELVDIAHAEKGSKR